MKFDSSVQKGDSFFGVSIHSIENLKIISSSSVLADSLEEDRGGLSYL